MVAGLKVETVIPGSLAEELEFAAGDTILTINGEPVRDVIDYNFLSSEDYLAVEVEKADGECWEVETERQECEPLGLIFAAPSPLQCGNNCIFCFVHQLPRGLRKPLYVKDEDYRLSFLYGNYVTLSNIDPSHFERIKLQRLSPLYISVHATDPQVREQLIGRKNLRPILPVMHELAQARIKMHCQVVLCPGVNDADVFERTVADLVSLYPMVSSLAVVPVGLTSHRDRLPVLAEVTSEFARAFVEEWGPRARQIAERVGEPFLFLADEFYLKASLPFPSLESYGSLPQLENGVGMVPLFMAEAELLLQNAKSVAAISATVVTGTSAYPCISSFLRHLAQKTGASITTIAVENRLFGPSVTVTGLVSGGDIIESLKGKPLGELVLIPDVMLKEGEGVFLDDLSTQDLEKALGRKVMVLEPTPQAIYDALRGSVL